MRRGAAKGKKVPELGDDPLLLPPDLKNIWEAFGVLNTTRGRGFGVEPITFVEIEAYCRLHEIKREDRVDFAFFITGLDECLLEWHSKKGN